jgi:hypothetical protein
MDSEEGYAIVSLSYIPASRFSTGSSSKGNSMTAAVAQTACALEGPPDHELMRIRDLVYQVAGIFTDQWELFTDLREVFSLHHSDPESHDHAGLIALVELSDLLCRMSRLSYGYAETREVNLLEQTSFAVLSRECPQLKDFDWPRLTFELDSYMDEVHSLVHAIYRA